jgi:hypothetical protein
VVVHVCNAGTQEAKARDHEFKVSLGYRVRLRTTTTKKQTDSLKEGVGLNEAKYVTVSVPCRCLENTLILI